jgi:glycosyltransferase involved in cell wall biosynthesis
MQKKIHVMQVTFGMGIGGMERVIMDLCRYVDPDRYRFSIVCISVRGLLADQMQAEGVPIIYCEKQSRLRKYLRSLDLAGIFRRSDVDIIHTHHTPAFVHSTIGAHLAGRPIIINTDHCKNYNTEKKHWMWLERGASWLIDEIVAVSNHTRDELIQYEKIAPEKISVIYNGINIKKTRTTSAGDIRKEFGIDNAQPIVGTVARLEDQKGLDLLLDSVPYVIAQLPTVKFLIVGGGKKEQELKSQAHRLGIEKNVIFTGWRSDAVDLLEAFDIFVSTSNFEGMPMVLLEAMALSKPVVATAVGGIPEVVEDGHTGNIIAERNPELVANTLTRLLSDTPLRERMGQAAHQSYNEKFSAEKMASNYEKLYRKFLVKRGHVLV